MLEIIKAENFKLQDKCYAYAGELMTAMAAAQQQNMINDPSDLRRLIASGIETALEDLVVDIEKVIESNSPKIELG